MPWPSSRQNNPLFLKTTQPDPGLKFHYMVHSALDAIEEKGMTPKKWIFFAKRQGLPGCPFGLIVALSHHVALVSSLTKLNSENREAFLGLLCPADEYRVSVLLVPCLCGWLGVLSHAVRCLSCRYGYMTNTKVKFVLVVDDQRTKDQDVRTVSS